MLTYDALVADIPKEDKAASAMPPDGDMLKRPMKAQSTPTESNSPNDPVTSLRSGLSSTTGGGGIRHSSCKSLSCNELEQSSKTGVIKSVIIYDDLANNPENEQLSAVVTAWSSLPSHIREVILLLVRQHVQ